MGAQKKENLAAPTAGRRCAVIGLMGGIGSGKTTVARMLSESGAKLVDADAISAELRKTPEIRQAIRDRWGDAVFDANRELDRSKLAAIVFNDPQELAALEEIMHPRVVEQIEREVVACRAGDGPATCAIDAPLLLESGLARLCDATIFVECDRGTRARRLIGSRGWAPAEIERREAHQQPLTRKREMADFVVVNDGDLAASRKQIERIIAQIKHSGV